MPPVPSPEVRATIAEKLSALSLAVETSPGFDRSSPQASGGLFYIWDFVKRTEYMLSELISGPPMMRNMMGMGGNIPPEAAAASKAVLEAFPEN
ncbi:hypothetical protein TGAM01_v206262 [Trichoderma gamsii]|uniref:Uncharacterized protein n=1 Tax=Trichoderma gamsii TaxID=398673 RepID=A0A2P4ZKF2_9HYPO|nr:hypothetical protein TGAM01_v206262 [Trichoderma gamsii]PON24754.1 hypothetical protein TGAM01_v206262 [Trichoderma gamsii]